MSLKSKFSHEFNPRIRDRGVGYFRSGSVDIVEHSDLHLEAVVKGTTDYKVRLTLIPHALAVACTCPYFDGGEECKHIWATMLAADSRNYLADVDQLGPLRLIDDDDALEELSEPEDEPEAEPSPIWRQRLSLVTNTVKNATTASRVNWPEGREIFYVVDPHSSRSSGLLNVELAIRERNKKGEWGKVKKAHIQQNQIPKLTDSRDRELLSILSGAKEAYWSAYSYGAFDLPNPVALSNILQPFLLPIMCATGRCVFRPEDKKDEPKTLVWDDATLWHFVLVIERTGDDYVLRPVLRSDSAQIDFADAVLTTDALVIDSSFRVARFDSQGARTWSIALKSAGDLKIPATEARELIAHLMDLPSHELCE